ncbi:MAG: glycosyltransferase family 2 protein [Thermoplasmata archaeon]|nr:glycosyltransferase family 2 protein [Thermoplasmata archaeon]
MKPQQSPGRAEVDVLVCTYNSATHLEECLKAARECLPIRRLIVVDRHSSDGTDRIALRWGADLHQEEVGLGFARTRAVALSTTPQILFLDSDVIVRRRDFVERGLEELRHPGTGAVVGTAVGHRFLYGLPLSLTLLDRAWASRVRVPPEVQGRETYYLQRELRRSRLGVRYLTDAYTHFGTYRAAPHWPEFQGAWVRITGGFSPRELLYSAMVVLLIQMNSRRRRNLAYAPIFYAKLLRGFLHPSRWRDLDRRSQSR